MVPIYPVILSGGNGSRLWPSSRKAMPKQFAPIMGLQSLFQQTLRRFSGAPFEPPVVMTHEDFRFLVRDQATDIGVFASEIVLEPTQKDTAPAILVAALLLADRPDALILITPSDHLVGDDDALVDAILAGASAASSGHLVTFGIQPDRPEPGMAILKLMLVRCAVRAPSRCAILSKGPTQSAPPQ